MLTAYYAPHNSFSRFIPSLALAADLRGVARVVDGDTLALWDTRIRLHALHAPEIDEPRGREARDVLRAIVEPKPITCRAVDRDRYGRIVADCENAEMQEGGGAGETEEARG
ncbi:hypothetical protein M1105_14175 [Limibaculum sp. FT325]|uniref:thermonuclease family protein n=1 Tax=Thermohalobaculum sediminis TaxID=2939436 RepID=UPI0020BE166F|nr:thermonuclease family protein [Limibaculum sediminis]MCL5778128.1 hypothetical protein [Limibaculum sediminis]